MHSTFNCSVVTELQEDCEILWVNLKLQGRRSVYICAYYRPDVSDEDSLKLLNTSMTRATSIENAHIILAGDLNLPYWDWKQMRMKPNPSYPRLHHFFLDMLGDLGMEQLVEEPTRADNTLDLLITNSPHLIPRVEVLPGLSDHDAVFCEINIHPQKRKQKPRLIPLYKQADWDALKQELGDWYTTLNTKGDSIPTEELWSSFKDTLHAGVQKHIPHKKVRLKESKPWITPAIRRLIRKRDRLYKKMRKRGREKYEKPYKDLRRQVQQQLRRSYWAYLNDIFEETDTNPSGANRHKRFWTYIKHLKTSNIVSCPPQGRRSAGH